MYACRSDGLPDLRSQDYMATGCATVAEELWDTILVNTMIHCLSNTTDLIDFSSGTMTFTSTFVFFVLGSLSPLSIPPAPLSPCQCRALYVILRSSTLACADKCAFGRCCAQIGRSGGAVPKSGVQAVPGLRLATRSRSRTSPTGPRTTATATRCMLGLGLNLTIAGPVTAS